MIYFYNLPRILNHLDHRYVPIFVDGLRFDLKVKLDAFRDISNSGRVMGLLKIEIED